MWALFGVPSEQFNQRLDIPESSLSLFKGSFSEALSHARAEKHLLAAYFHGGAGEKLAKTVLAGTEALHRHTCWAGDASRAENDGICRRVCHVDAPCIAIVMPCQRPVAGSCEWPRGNHFQVLSRLPLVFPSQEPPRPEALLGVFSAMLATAEEEAYQNEREESATASGSQPRAEASGSHERASSAVCNCPICLEPVSVPVLASSCCNTLLHQRCLASWLLAQAEEGWFPCRCPCTSCRAPVSEALARRALSSEELQRYNLYIKKAAELRALRGVRPLDSPRSARAYQEMGCRQCPSCGAWIEKHDPMKGGVASIVEGCDLMTCRCGQRFCFNCGRAGGKCDCPGNQGHSFLPHEEVLLNYPTSRAAEYLDSVLASCLHR